jgi:hypothetical protein
LLGPPVVNSEGTWYPAYCTVGIFKGGQHAYFNALEADLV